MEIASAPRSGAVVATLRDAEVRRGDFVLGPVSSDRLGGPGGGDGSERRGQVHAAPPPFLGRVPLDAGHAALGSGASCSARSTRPASCSTAPEALLDAFRSATPDTEPAEIRTLLAARPLKADHVMRPASTLSPGERTRAALALLQGRGVNLLILDEPTNHLDLPAIEQLEAALDAYEGTTLLLITHDRRMLDAVRVTRRLEVTDGKVVGAHVAAPPRLRAVVPPGRHGWAQRHRPAPARAPTPSYNTACLRQPGSPQRVSHRVVGRSRRRRPPLPPLTAAAGGCRCCRCLRRLPSALPLLLPGRTPAHPAGRPRRPAATSTRSASAECRRPSPSPSRCPRASPHPADPSRTSSTWPTHVHQPVLVHTDVHERTEGRDIRHDTLQDHPGGQVGDLLHALLEGGRLERRAAGRAPASPAPSECP